MRPICKNSICDVDYPHSHVDATINSPAVSAPWPERLQWRRPKKETYDGNPYYLFKFGWFTSHSKFQLPWKLDLEGGLSAGDWDTIARIIAWKFAFSAVHGIPKGGTKLARMLEQYITPGYPMLIVDDVLTTGKSMQQAREDLGAENAVGVVVVARGPCPNWVWPIMVVSEWAQSRATGLG